MKVVPTHAEDAGRRCQQGRCKPGRTTAVVEKIKSRHLVNSTSSTLRPHERWAHFRFSVIGPLLAAPPDRGQLRTQLQELAAKKWRHPISGQWVLFGRSTLERWYYKALRSKAGPVEALKRKIRSDHGQHPSVTPKLIELLTLQHRQHPSWSYQLHFDNLVVVVEQ